MNELISRQAVKDWLQRWIGYLDNDMIARMQYRVIDIPSAERKKGKWIKKMRVTETERYIAYEPEWYCACCGTKYDSHIAKVVNFCYVCGVDMRGRKEE